MMIFWNDNNDIDDDETDYDDDDIIDYDDNYNI